MDTPASKNEKIVEYHDQTKASNKTDVWEDESFVSEMERRTTELENGTVKGYTWEEVKSIALQARNQNA